MTQPVLRPTVQTTLQDLVKRVRALEAVPPGGSGLYVDNRVLGADTTFVLFDSFPANLSILEITWRAAHNGSGSSNTGVGMLMFNQNHFPDDSDDWWWNLDIPNSVGGQTQLLDSTYTNAAGGFAFVPNFADHNSPGAGAIRLPNYAQNAMGDSQAYVGYGQADVPTGGDPGLLTPEDFLVGGYRQDTGAITSMLLGCFDITDPTLATQDDWKAGSSFCLLGYPAV